MGMKLPTTNQKTTMAEINPSDAELAAAISTPADLNFQLPDPEDEGIEDVEFSEQVDQFWLVCARVAELCSRFDLQLRKQPPLASRYLARTHS